MYDAKESKAGDQFLFPRDNDMQYIPEFSVIDMRVMSGNNESEQGYGLKLQRITLHPTTLYSYLGPESLYMLPESIGSATELAVGRAADSRFIHLQLEGKNLGFCSKVAANSFISSTPVAEGYYRLVGPGSAELLPGVPSVDISVADLLRHANIVPKEGEEVAELVQQAITLFDFASAAGALSVYAVCCRYFKTGDPNLGDFKGVPLVDVDLFLQSVDFHGMLQEGEDGEVGEGVSADILEDRVIFPFKHEICNLGGKAFVTVWTNPITPSLLLNSAEPPELVPAPAADFSILSEDCSVAKGYLVTIGTKEDPDILRFVLNVMGCQRSVAGGSGQRVDYSSKKRKQSPVLLALLSKRQAGGEQ